MDMNVIDIYDVMEEKLIDDIREVSTIKTLGKEIISKMKLIDEAINIINPDHIEWNDLSKIQRDKLGALYSLKIQYRSQFDMIAIILNKDNRVVRNFIRSKFEEIGLDGKFIIEDLKS